MILMAEHGASLLGRCTSTSKVNVIDSKDYDKTSGNIGVLNTGLNESHSFYEIAKSLRSQQHDIAHISEQSLGVRLG